MWSLFYLRTCVALYLCKSEWSGKVKQSKFREPSSLQKSYLKVGTNLANREGKCPGLWNDHTHIDSLWPEQEGYHLNGRVRLSPQPTSYLCKYMVCIPSSRLYFLSVYLFSPIFRPFMFFSTGDHSCDHLRLLSQEINKGSSQWEPCWRQNPLCLWTT